MSTIKSKEDANYEIQGNDLIPLISNDESQSKSVNPKQISKSILGSNTLTIGPRGRFSTIELALAYITSQPKMTQVDVSTMTITVNASEDFVTCSIPPFDAGIRSGDLMYLNDDKNGQFGGFEKDDHYYAILTCGGQDELGGDQTPYDRFTTFNGILGGDKVNYTATFWRPVKWTFILEAGEHNIATDTDVPEGVHLSIIGQGEASQITGERIGLPFSGFLQIKDVYGKGTQVVKANSLAVTFWSVDCTAILKLDNFRCDGQSGNVFAFVLGGIYFNNVDVDNAIDHPTLPTCDFCNVNGFNVTHGESTEGMNHEVYWHGNSNKIKHIKNVTIRRRPMPAVTARAPGKLVAVRSSGSDLSSNVRDHIYNFSNLHLYDESDFNDLNRVPRIFYVQGPTSGTVKLIVNVSDSIFEIAPGCVLPYHIACFDLAELTLKNIKTLEGKTPTIDPASTGIIRNLDSDSLLDIDYAASLSIDAGWARTWVVGTLTGDITINAPANPVKGYTLSFIFEQDATGGRNISWNAVFKGVNESSGLANQKVIFKFIYDGTDWLLEDLNQIGGWRTIQEVVIDTDETNPIVFSIPPSAKIARIEGLIQSTSTLVSLPAIRLNGLSTAIYNYLRIDTTNSGDNAPIIGTADTEFQFTSAFGLGEQCIIDIQIPISNTVTRQLFKSTGFNNGGSNGDYHTCVGWAANANNVTSIELLTISPLANGIGAGSFFKLSIFE